MKAFKPTLIVSAILLALQTNSQITRRTPLDINNSPTTDAKQNIDCTPINLSSCNYITNPSFQTNNYNPNDFWHVYKPFELGLVLPWQPSHGTPQLTDNYNGTPPFSGVNYAFMFSEPGGNNEGIFQKIPQLEQGRKYALSFFMRFAQFGAPGSAPFMEKFYIVLMNCSDADIFSPLTENLPAIPANSQVIYCEQNISNTNWEQEFTCFTANANYDLIWVFPKKEVAPYQNNFGGICFAFPELIDVTNFSAGPSPNPAPPNCNVVIGPQTPNCSVINAVYTWIGPNGERITAPANQQITVNSLTQYGTWTLIMSIPGLNGGSYLCGYECNILSTVYVPECVSCDRPTVSPSGPVTYYNWYETPNQMTLTSSNPIGNQWYKNGVLIPGATGQTYNISVPGGNLPYTITDYYTVSAGGCSSIPVSFTEVNCDDESDYPVSVQFHYCASNPSGVSTQVNLGTGSSYAWSTLTNPTCITFSNQINNSITISYAACQSWYTNGIYTMAENQGQQVRMFYWANLLPYCRSMTSSGMESDNVKILPNPAKYQINISSSKLFESVEIYDLFSPISKIIKTGRTTNATINISDLNPGNYYCKIMTESGPKYIRLLIQR